jgi:hypothetical protein
MRARPRYKHRPGSEVVDLFPRDRVRETGLSVRETWALMLASAGITVLLAIVMGAL